MSGIHYYMYVRLTYYNRRPLDDSVWFVVTMRYSRFRNEINVCQIKDTGLRTSLRVIICILELI